jgi:hypothetical protein
MFSREKDLILKIKNKIKDKRINRNKLVLNFMKKNFEKSTIEDLSEREKYKLLSFLEDVIK